MNTSKYSSSTRQSTKIDQRSEAYRDLQQRSAHARALLERKLRERNETIERLKKKLAESGIPEEEIAKLAA